MLGNHGYAPQQAPAAAPAPIAATKALQGQYDETRSLANEVLQYDTASARAYALQAYAYLLAGGGGEGIGGITGAGWGFPRFPRHGGRNPGGGFASREIRRLGVSTDGAPEGPPPRG